MNTSLVLPRPEIARVVRFVPVLPPIHSGFPTGKHCAQVGFWNWNNSAFIVDGVGYGDTEEQATVNAWRDYENEAKRPHVAEDALGLGHLSD